MSPRNFISAHHLAARVLLLLVLWALAALALAAPVAATVTHLSGPLLAKKASGAVKILSVKSEVENGDTLVTEKSTYARLKFIDNSEMTLKPDTTMTIENFGFDEARQDGDVARFNLVKGSLRSVTGLLGKRSKEKFELKTPVATIGIRGTTFIVEYTGVPGASALATMRAPGLYLQVLDGIVVMTNQAASLDFTAGQFGFVPALHQPPVLLPVDPGIQFAPPPVFSSSAGPEKVAPANGDGMVDCVVR